MAVHSPTFEEFCKAHELSPHQSRVVGMVLKGRDNRQIAAKLNTPEQCVKNSLGMIYAKLGVRGNANNKRFRLLIKVNQWAREEKNRRVREKMDV